MYVNIVVGTDGSATATKAVSAAADLAAMASATLVVVSAYRPVPEERLRSERSGAPEDVAYWSTVRRMSTGSSSDARSWRSQGG